MKMDMLIQIVLLVVGFVLLVKGADWVVEVLLKSLAFRSLS